MNLFIDTEFTGLEEYQQGALISIALVSQDLAWSFYAELTDTYWRQDCSLFVRDRVLPHLGDEQVARSAPLGHSIHAAMNLATTTQSLRSWFSLLYHDQPRDQRGVREPLRIWSSSPPHDGFWLHKLFHTDLPNTIEPACHQVAADTLEQQRAGDDVRLRLESAVGFRKHHALDDAKVLAQVWAAQHTPQQPAAWH